jgi:hypothetical protein
MILMMIGTVVSYFHRIECCEIGASAWCGSDMVARAYALFTCSLSAGRPARGTGEASRDGKGAQSRESRGAQADSALRFAGTDSQKSHQIVNLQSRMC